MPVYVIDESSFVDKNGAIYGFKEIVKKTVAYSHNSTKTYQY